MSIVLIIVFFIILIISLSVSEDAAAVPFILLIASIVLAIISTARVINVRVIDDKITMYQEENKNIETQLDVLVDKYMDYEFNTLREVKGESSVTLVSLFPELKSDELVQQQIKVYIDNNNKIKQLKEEKLNVNTWKWWLYFGG